MDWQYIEKVLGVSPHLVGDRANEILTSVAHLEAELGRRWIENAWPNSSGIAVADMLVEFSKCLKITEKIQRGSLLKKKLLAGYHSAEAQHAMAEAHVAIRLVESGAQVVYEPKIPNEPKRPDFLAFLDKKPASFEVTRLDLSAEDSEQQKRQHSLAEKCGNILPSGSLDIYITDTEISPQAVDLIIDSVHKLGSAGTDKKCLEQQVSDTVYLAYDPIGSVRKDHTNAPKITTPTESKAIGICIHDVEADRSRDIKKKLKVQFPMPAVARVAPQTLSDGSQIATLVRIFRVAIDARVMTKAIEESSQLPSNIPGVVVIDLNAAIGYFFLSQSEKWPIFTG
jgi:hypothetical protein